MPSRVYLNPSTATGESEISTDTSGQERPHKKPSCNKRACSVLSLENQQLKPKTSPLVPPIAAGLPEAQEKRKQVKRFKKPAKDWSASEWGTYVMSLTNQLETNKLKHYNDRNGPVWKWRCRYYNTTKCPFQLQWQDMKDGRVKEKIGHQHRGCPLAEHPIQEEAKPIFVGQSVQVPHMPLQHKQHPCTAQPPSTQHRDILMKPRQTVRFAPLPLSQAGQFQPEPADNALYLWGANISNHYFASKFWKNGYGALFACLFSVNVTPAAFFCRTHSRGIPLGGGGQASGTSHECYVGVITTTLYSSSLEEVFQANRRVFEFLQQQTSNGRVTENKYANTAHLQRNPDKTPAQTNLQVARL